MKEILTVKEAAALWNVTPRAVTTLCKEGKIENARKEKGIWIIPADVKRPLDRRLKTGAYRKAAQMCIRDSMGTLLRGTPCCTYRCRMRI